MKKISIFMSLAFMLSVLFVACGPKVEKVSDAPNGTAIFKNLNTGKFFVQKDKVKPFGEQTFDAISIFDGSYFRIGNDYFDTDGKKVYSAPEVVATGDYYVANGKTILDKKFKEMLTGDHVLLKGTIAIVTKAGKASVYNLPDMEPFLKEKDAIKTLTAGTYAVQYGKNWKVYAENGTETKAYAAEPVVEEDRIMIKQGRNKFFIDAKTGKVQWK